MRSKRQATLYDAVAGRVTANGLIFDKATASVHTDGHASKALCLTPDEATFQSAAAPDRYEENDFYWAHKHLTTDQALPGSDLLKAVHVYASEFYTRAMVDEGLGDMRSMDETALLAMGILLEEAVKHSLGENGHLVFVEGEPDEVDNEGLDVPLVQYRERSDSRGSNLTTDGSGEPRKRKRRKREPKRNGGFA
ncbi:hypothetical protein MMC19_007012 [Ptychographa xylographoides]|nr:hypothetical protein [Ptychographa xylographoides]